MAKTPVPVISYSKDQRIIIPPPRHDNYEEALETINNINYTVANNLRSGNFPNARPVDPFFQKLAKAAFMTGTDVVEKLCLDHTLDIDNRDLQFFANYIKVSRDTDISFSIFTNIVRGSTDFFSHPDEFAQRHISGSSIIIRGSDF